MSGDMNGVKNGAIILRRRSAVPNTGVPANAAPASVLPPLSEYLMLSITDRTRSLMEPRLLTSSILSRVSALPCCLSRLRISSVTNASGPQPNEVICMN